MKKIHPNFDLTTSSHLFSFLFMVVAVGWGSAIWKARGCELGPKSEGCI
jgi:hypothetical protein